MKDYMKEAYLEAQKGVQLKDGGPFGAVVVDQQGNIIGLGHNQVLTHHDPTAHAEITAIREACQTLHTHDLSGCILYTLCEPCPMCLSAIIWSNIKEVYFACDRKDAAAIGFRDDAIYEYLDGTRQDLLRITAMDKSEYRTLFFNYDGERY